MRLNDQTCKCVRIILTFLTRYKFLNSFQFSGSMKHKSTNMTSYRLHERDSPDSHCLPLTLRHCVRHKSEIRRENEVRVWKIMAKQLVYCGKFISQKLLLIGMGLIIQRWDIMKSQLLSSTEHKRIIGKGERTLSNHWHLSWNWLSDCPRLFSHIKTFHVVIPGLWKIHCAEDPRPTQVPIVCTVKEPLGHSNSNWKRYINNAVEEKIFL